MSSKRFAALCILVGLLFCCLVACADKGRVAELPDGEDTPVRLGQLGTIDESRTTAPLTMQQAYEKADLIAELEVVGYLGEHITKFNRGATFFNARLNRVYKNETGKELNEVTLIQSGNSKYTDARYPLFNRGERLIVFLTAVENEDTSAYENCFIIVDASRTNIEIFKYKGEEYAINLGWSEHFQDIPTAVKDDILPEISTAFLNGDPIWKEVGIDTVGKIVLLSELSAYLISFEE